MLGNGLSFLEFDAVEVRRNMLDFYPMHALNSDETVRSARRQVSCHHSGSDSMIVIHCDTCRDGTW